MEAQLLEEQFRPENDPFAKQLKRRKRKNPWTTAGQCALGLAVALGAWMTFTTHGRAVRQNLPNIVPIIEAHQDPNYIFTAAGNDKVNILLIGRDVDYAQVYKDGVNIGHKEITSNARSDSMIVLTLDKNSKSVRMISLPRDAIVHMPPNKYHVEQAKLNAAHAYGGPKMLERTLHDELGLTIHRYAEFKFDGFKNLIDQVGGVDVDVDGALLRNKETHKLYRGDLNYDDNWGNLHIHIKKGLQHLDGQRAHDYVRYREDIEGDPGRIRRQQQVVRALARQIMNSNTFDKLGIIDELQKQFITDMSTKELASTAFFAKSVGDPNKIQPLTLFGIFTSRGNFTLNHDKNVAVMKVVFGNTFDPDNFLPNSPQTEEDEIGKTNNSNPGSMEILREAGLISDGKGGIKQVDVASLPAQPGLSGTDLQVDANGAANPAPTEDPVTAPLLQPGSGPMSPSDSNAPVGVSTDTNAATPHHRHHKHHVAPSDDDDTPVRSE